MRYHLIINRKPKWPNWKEEQDCSKEELEIANLRELRNNEIVLDSETQEHSKKVYEQLSKDNISFERWDTGSRGQHFHIYIKRLKELLLEEREDYRSKVIQEYGCDPSKKNGLIARKGKPHYKTGKKKTLIENVKKKENLLRIDFLYRVKSKRERDPIIDQIKRDMKVSELLEHYGGAVKSPTIALCPIHPEKNPSFGYDDGDGVWWCFHSKIGGDVFSLVMEKENVPFKSAKEILMLKLGIKDPAIEQLGLDGGIQIKKVSDIIDSDIPKPKWRVENLIPESGVTYLAAPPGEGKSLLMNYICQTIVSDKKFMGLKVLPGKIVYFDGENGEICAWDRLKRIAKGNDFKQEDLEQFSYSIFPNIRFDKDHSFYDDFLEFFDKEKPNMVVFDSLVRFMDGSENDAESCKKVFDALRELLKLYPNLTIVILHHVTKANEGGMNSLRGSSEIAAAASSIIMLKRIDEVFKLSIEKSRYVDMSKGYKIYYKVRDDLENNIVFEDSEPTFEADSSTARAEREFWLWVNGKNIEIFEGATCQTQLQSKGHSKTAIYKMINTLLDMGNIAVIQRGKYKIKNMVYIKEEEVS